MLVRLGICCCFFFQFNFEWLFELMLLYIFRLVRFFFSPLEQDEKKMWMLLKLKVTCCALLALCSLQRDEVNIITNGPWWGGVGVFI
jgi:hypothetical protein